MKFKLKEVQKQSPIKYKTKICFIIGVLPVSKKTV